MEIIQRKPNMKSFKEVVNEARGRTGADSAEDDGKEPDQHIHVQMKTAADMAHDEVKGKDGFKTKGGADIKFENGTHFVPAGHAKTVLAALDKLKPPDREKMHAHIQQSHANFQAVHKLVS